MKRFLYLLSALILVLSLIPGAFAASVSSFTDVSTGDWFYSAVRTVTERNMFNGTSSSTFSPGDTMTRGMFVTVLGRYGNITPTLPSSNQGVVTKTDVRLRSAPTTVDSTVLATLAINTQVEIIGLVDDSVDPAYKWYYVNYNDTKGYIRNDLMEPRLYDLTDVPEKEYYSGYVYWSVSSGIAQKTGESTFSPNIAVTREEICSMLYNFAATKNLALNPTAAAISFTDSASITPSYAAAVSAVQRAGIIKGYEDGSFHPKSGATRAEVSAMLSRFIEAVSYKPIVENSVDANGNYIWGTEHPQSSAVGPEYFDDACFIGHSIVVGMSSYFEVSNADFYAYNGATAKGIQSYSGFELPTPGTDANGNPVKRTGTLAEALGEETYGKVYIMLGANEAGVGSSHEQNFFSQLASIIDLVRGFQPNAKIYLFSFTPVTQVCSEGRADLSRDNIIRYNALIKQLSGDKQAYYLNVFDLLINTEGFLPDTAGMSDGIHLHASQYSLIRDYVIKRTAS